MKNEEAIKELKIQFVGEYDRQREAKDMAIKALGRQDRIIQILDDYELEAWEILEKIKEAVKA